MIASLSKSKTRWAAVAPSASAAGSAGAVDTARSPEALIARPWRQVNIVDQRSTRLTVAITTGGNRAAFVDKLMTRDGFGLPSEAFGVTYP
jgi:hypothetical protein